MNKEEFARKFAESSITEADVTEFKEYVATADKAEARVFIRDLVQASTKKPGLFKRNLAMVMAIIVEKSSDLYGISPR